MLKLVNALKQHKSREERYNPKSDMILIGLLKLIDRILKVRPELRPVVAAKETGDLLSFVFDQCLFRINTGEDESIDP